MNEFGGGLGFFSFRDNDFVERDDVNIVEPVAGNPIAAKRVLEDGFLLQDIGWGDEQILPGVGDFGGGAGNFDGGHAADFDLRLVVVEQFLRGGWLGL